MMKSRKQEKDESLEVWGKESGKEKGGCTLLCVFIWGKDKLNPERKMTETPTSEWGWGASSGRLKNPKKSAFHKKLKRKNQAYMHGNYLSE